MKSLLQWPLKTKNDIMNILDKNYIENKIKKRKGKCRKCGKCCGNCRFLDKKTRLCTVYTKRSHIFCYQNFPLSKLDQKAWNVEGCCGYTFQ